MKTTIDLPDDLLLEAKSLAARRRTTLKTIIENALRREIRPECERANPDPDKYEMGPLGILSLKKRGQPLTAEQVQHLIDHQYDEEDDRVMRGAAGQS